MSTEAPVVYIVDDEPAVLRAVSRLLTSAGFRVRAFESPLRFVAEHDAEISGCVLADLSMPEMDGLALQEALCSPTDDAPARPIIFLSGRADIPSSVQAMKQGAIDFLTKPVDDEALLDAVRRAIDRDLEARRGRRALESLHERWRSLTPREREVMERVVAGRLNKQIAYELGTAEKTIKVHRGRVMQKMQADSLADLVRMAQRLSTPPV